MSHWEEASGKTPDMLEGLRLSADLGTPEELEEMSGEREVWGCLRPSPTRPQLKRMKMDGFQVIYYEELRLPTYQSVQQLQLQWRYCAAKLGSIGTGLLAALQQLKQSCVHAEGLGGSSPKAFKVQNRRAQESDLGK